MRLYEIIIIIIKYKSFRDSYVMKFSVDQILNLSEMKVLDFQEIEGGLDTYSGFRSYEVHLSPLIACGEGVGGGVLVPHNRWKCCK